MRLVTAALLFTMALHAAIRVELDPARTQVAFTLSATLHAVHGTFSLKSGAIEFDAATGHATGAIVIDAASGQSGNTARDQKMHQSVLETARFPEFLFSPDRVSGAIAPEGESQIQVHGIFRIHGADHEATLSFQVQAHEGRFTATTKLSVPYVKWGMKNPGVFLLRVGDVVDINITAAGKIIGASNL